MTDILDRLRKWAGYKVGDAMPNDWGPALTADLKDAIAEIERLREHEQPKDEIGQDATKPRKS